MAILRDVRHGVGGWLPPDNYQEEGAEPRLARRTSPTNVAMGLLSTLAAHDLGYVPTTSAIERLDRMLTTLEGLERHEGHLLNWYNTATLAPLHPRYVSTVDSGNLAGALVALVQGLLGLTVRPQRRDQLLEGLVDTAELLAAASSSMSARNSRHDLVLSRPERRQPGPTGRRRNTLTSVNTPGTWDCRRGTRGVARESALELRSRSRHSSRIAEESAGADIDPTARSRSGVERCWRRSRRSTFSGGLRSAASCAGLRAAALCDGMRFGFLYDRRRRIFSIGYRLADAEGPGRLDASFYDLLASEARLASFVAIAKGDVPQHHWFHLGRL